MSSTAWKKLSLRQKLPSDWLSDGPKQSGVSEPIRGIFSLGHSKDLFIKAEAVGKVEVEKGKNKEKLPEEEKAPGRSHCSFSVLLRVLIEKMGRNFLLGQIMTGQREIILI